MVTGKGITLAKLIKTFTNMIIFRSPKTKVASLVSAFNSTFLPKSKSTKTSSSPPYLDKSNSLPKSGNVASPPAKHSLMPSVCTNYSHSTPSKQSSIASSSDSKPLTVSQKQIKQSVANNQKITSASHNNLLAEDTKVHQKTHSFGEKKSSLRFSSSKFGSMTRDKSPNNNNMARSISISNFRTKHNNSAVVCKSPCSLNVSEQNLNRKRVYSMPKLNQTDSLTRNKNSDLKLPSDDEKVKL